MLFQYLKKNQQDYHKQILNIVTTSPLREEDIKRLQWLQTANCVVNGLLNVQLSEINDYLEVDYESGV